MEVLVNDVPFGEWRFRFKSGASEYQTYRMVLSQKTLDKALPCGHSISRERSGFARGRRFEWRYAHARTGSAPLTLAAAVIGWE